ncbi:hypothetical protein CPC08DRAFT_770950 [Agrocybe pediades]|nr:hypothetical protein CPC08DRAFT_770950 [Agrocybe pediades]
MEEGGGSSSPPFSSCRPPPLRYISSLSSQPTSAVSSFLPSCFLLLAPIRCLLLLLLSTSHSHSSSSSSPCFLSPLAFILTLLLTVPAAPAAPLYLPLALTLCLLALSSCPTSEHSWGCKATCSIVETGSGWVAMVSTLATLEMLGALGALVNM